MCVWKKTLCVGRSGTCQHEFSRYRETDCGNHHDDMSASTSWILVREGTCVSCLYPTPPDTDSE
ncbi:hypothetical protein F5B19DRAFT_372833 [Rostrohypoxylon terebratum]|nr:hypothetical protein F5B19DRAFT_372833 [Rostrohypoxylon terebratum]